MYEVIENKANSREFDINMKNGWICYSDFPLFFDIDTYNDFKESKKDVNLYLYNIIVIISVQRYYLPYVVVTINLSVTKLQIPLTGSL
ncbi:MAG TPA: hypothetical protein PLF27_12045 [Sedimentibacter sp.]|nr:hypothetical protein [Sedimentibacter sp.]